MRILVDVERLRNPNNGLGQLCARLGEELSRQQRRDSSLTFLIPEGRRGTFGPRVDYVVPRWWQRVWPTGSYDVWHATHQDSAFIPSRRSRVVLTILDLNFLERPDYDAAKKARRLAIVQRRVNRAAAVATISEYTATVVREHLNVPDVPLQVIYLGNPLPREGVAERPAGDPVLANLTDADRFLLFVGVLHPKKNVHTLLPAMSDLPDWKLVLAGPDGHSYAARLRADVEMLGLRTRVLIPGAVDESTKRWLYQHCRALVFPSLSEGFGLPVLEAMTNGKPAFLSRLTSLPEIGGTAAFYFDSFESAAMARTIREGLDVVARDPGSADRFRRHAASFSWARAAQQYWELYETVMTKRVASAR